MRGERRAALAAAVAALVPTAGGVAALVVSGADVATTIAVAAGGVVMAVAGAWGASRVVRGGLRRVARQVAVYRAGDIPVLGAPKGAEGEAQDELAHWAVQLREERRALQESLNVTRLLADALPSAVFVIDDTGRVVYGNRAAAAALGTTVDRLPGSDASTWELGAWLEGDAPRWIERRSAGGPGLWELERWPLDRGGRAHTVLVLSDRTALVHGEERLAWERMLAALRAGDGVSFAAARRDPRRLTPPPPQPALIDAAAWIPPVAACYPDVRVVPGPPALTRADPTHLADALAELLANAVDATCAAGGGVPRLAWRKTGEWLEILIEDEGDGLPRDSDIFAPCVTTRGDRAGFGLVVARARCEAAGGSLTVVPRPGDRGTLARVRIPLAGEASD